MARVRLGEEFVIESGARAVTVVRPAKPGTSPGRLLSESIASAEARGPMTLLDAGFTRDLEEVADSYREPLNQPSWD